MMESSPSPQAQLHQTKAVLAQSDSEVAELRLRAESQARRLREQEELQHMLEMERRRLHNLVQELKVSARGKRILCWKKNPNLAVFMALFPHPGEHPCVLPCEAAAGC